MFPRVRGFTLIELLIVVAIIAVLAAIAVPNYLHAQIRAKVAQEQQDLRLLAHGLEAYRGEHRALPDPGVFVPGNYNLAFRLVPLTTPVAYLSQLPRDPFPRGYFSGDYQIHLNNYEGGDAYVYGRGDRAGTMGLLDSGAENFMLAGAAPDQFLNQLNYTLPSLVVSATTQEIRLPCGCPAIVSGSQAVYLELTPYDPSNRIISHGDIYRWGGIHGTRD